MPQIVPAIIIGVKTIGGFLLANTITGTIARAVLGFAITSLFSRKPKGPTAAIAADEGVDVNLRIAPDDPIAILYGRTATGGTLAWSGVRGTDNEYLERVVRLSDYTCEAIVKIIGDGDDLTFSGDLTTGYRSCTSHYLDESGNPCLSVKIFLGDPDQTADGDLVSNYAAITSNFRGRGRAYAIVRMKWNRDAFPNGEPRLTYVMDGVACYDPRLDSTVTGGSGSHRSDDFTTWEWTDNPALIAAQYHQGWKINSKLVGGLGYDRARIPDADLIEAANECDEAVNLDVGGTENRYRCGGGFMLGRNGRTHRANLEQIMNAMDGELDDGAGLNIRFIPGVERTPVSFEIKFADVLQQDIDFNPEIEPGQEVNQATCRYTDPDEGYRLYEVPLRTDATALARSNGQEYTFDEDIPAVQSFTQAQRILKRKINRAQAPRTFTFSLPIWYIQLEKGDRVTLDFEFVARYRLPQAIYRVDQRPLITPDMRVAVSLREHPATIGDWTPATDEVTKNALTQTRPGIPALTISSVAVSAVELEQSAVKMPLIRMTWTGGDPRTRVLVRAIALDGASPPAPASPAQEWTANVAADTGQADIFVVAAAQYKVVYQLYFEGRYTVETVASAAISATGNFEPTGINGVSAADISAAADDGTLTPSEKNLIVPYLEGLIAEQTALTARAALYSVSATAYTTAMSTLTTYLGTLISAVAWNNLSGNTTITAATWVANIQGAVEARDALVDAVETASGRNNITITGGGINGIGTGTGTVIDNTLITINSAGVLSGGGGGAVTFGGLGGGTLGTFNTLSWTDAEFTGIPTNLAALTGTEVITNTSITISSGGINGIGTGDGTLIANSAIVAGDIPTLDAAKIGTGTFDVARVPSLTLAKISDAGTLAAKSEVATTDLAAAFEIKDGSGNLMVSRSTGKLYVDGYEVNRLFTSSPGSEIAIVDSDVGGKVIARANLLDVRAINTWGLIGSDVVFGTPGKGTMAGTDTANFRFRIFITGPDASPPAINAAFSLGGSVYNRPLGTWDISFTGAGGVIIKSADITGNPTIDGDEFNEEVGARLPRFPAAEAGNCYVYFVGYWISTDASPSSGISLKFTTDTTLAVTNLINRAAA